LYRIRPWGRLLLATCLAASSAGTAVAQNYDDSPLPDWYVGPLLGVMLPDSARNTDAGPNLQFVAGAALADSMYLEGTVFGGDDSMAGAGIDLTLGTAAPGNPFFMVGAGAVSHEIGGSKETTGFGNLGFGVYLPITTVPNLLWRAEFRYNLLFDGHPSLPSENMLEDGRINLGVLWTFGESRAQAIEAVEAAETAPDADGDGVPDARDKCPDTPRWVRADENGCAPDSDGDGVDEPRDSCPDSPAGVPVDANGCPVSEKTETKAEPETVLDRGPDRDSDGVPDSLDACPHTAGALPVDERGCVRPEAIQLRNVHFDLESTRLTGDGFLLLRQIAATLRAYPEMRIEISGHADASGSNKYNEKLSVRRAEIVHDFLHYLGIAESRMDLKAYGEGRPVADNKTDEGRAMNRRVEFKELK
jgi:OOP family OmpA-OmpF porin